MAEITVAKLIELLHQLRAEDLIDTNEVGNLRIFRNGYIGFIDLNDETIQIYE